MSEGIINLGNDLSKSGSTWQKVIGLIISLVAVLMSSGFVIEASVPDQINVIETQRYRVTIDCEVPVDVYDNLGDYVGSFSLRLADCLISWEASVTDIVLHDPTEAPHIGSNLAVNGGDSGFVYDPSVWIVNDSVTYMTVRVWAEFGQWFIPSHLDIAGTTGIYWISSLVYYDPILTTTADIFKDNPDVSLSLNVQVHSVTVDTYDVSWTFEIAFGGYEYTGNSIYADGHDWFEVYDYYLAGIL